VYLPGGFNVVGDTLSCPASGIHCQGSPLLAVITNRAPFDLRDMGLRQIHCTQAVLWNRNYFLRFRFRLLKSYGSGSDFRKSYGSGSGSYFRNVTVPVLVPVPVPVPAPYLDHKKQNFQKNFGKYFAF
jgi:hypothetical protein